VLAASATARAGVVERIVAVVNDDIVLQSELDERARPFLAEAEREGGDAEGKARRGRAIRREVLDRLVDELLILQQSRELKVVVTPEDVDKAVDEVKRRNKIDEGQLREALAQQGYDLAGYREEIKRQIVRLKVIEIAVRARLAVSDDDVKRYYEQNLRQLGAERKVRASHIFVAIPGGSTAAVVEARRRFAGGLVERARAGEDFAKLARQYSEDPATRAEGGDLGYFGRGMLPAPVEEVVFAMDPGDVRGPIRAERGFHVIKLVDRKDEAARPLEEIKDQLREQLFQQGIEKQTRIWLQELRKRANVEVRD
jgi:parvulin-like peptidyl-prolyl isomerase